MAIINANVAEIEELTKLISKLPGLGPKSAKRIILKLINNKDELYKPMGKFNGQGLKMLLDVIFVEV